MRFKHQKRKLWLKAIWIASLIALIALILFPVSNGLTRAAGLVVLGIVWFGLIALVWHRKAFRVCLIAITFLLAAFLSMPSRSSKSVEALRQDYVTCLRKYDGVDYVWGGENFNGIDCSGLIRRGLVDARILRGMHSFDGALVREGLGLWWNDRSAQFLGEANGEQTHSLFETPSLNEVDASRLLPGDLAVSRSGAHILAYLGGNQWIEADPSAGAVLSVSVPASGNSWFRIPMKLVRWRFLE